MKIKKAITVLTLLCLIMTSIPAMAVGASNQSVKKEVCTAYYDLLREKIDENGYLAPSALKKFPGVIYDSDKAVVYAKLIDFDNNGVDELFLIQIRPIKDENIDGNEANYFVYTYQNGAVKLLHNEPLSILVQEYGFTKDKNGKQYYYQRDDYGGSNIEFYTVVNGSWKKAYSLNQDTLAKWTISGKIAGQPITIKSSDAKAVFYKINSQSVKQNEYYNKLNFLTNTVQGYDYFINKIPDWTPQNVLKELEKNLPAGYLATYSTPSAWAKSAVEQGISSGIVPKNLQKTYAKPITRAEFCALAVNFYEKYNNAAITQRVQFKDTTDVNVQKMADLGIVNGVGNNRFDPNGSLTREAAAAILVNLSEKMNGKTADVAPNFADNAQISAWAYNQVGKAGALGIMNGTGDNKFSPKASYTREQSIATFVNMQSKVTDNIKSISVPDSIEVGVYRDKAIPIEINSDREIPLSALRWDSGNPNIAKVDATGNVTGVAVGETIILVSASNGISAVCKVIVIKDDTDYTSVVHDKLPITINCLNGTVVITNIEGKPSADKKTYDITIEGNIPNLNSEQMHENTYSGYINFSVNIDNSFRKMVTVGNDDDPCTFKRQLSVPYSNKEFSVKFDSGDKYMIKLNTVK